MDSREPWITFIMLLIVHPSDIQAQGTPEASHGTKKIRQNFSHIIKNPMFYKKIETWENKHKNELPL